ncbi:hypothetical protein BT96DRAFT_648395 [Gymnopus androsaceus JB14]|uniref:Uncharacterized protein n=1 Tax=Gymnopus androsaceus JB14 TaxID=1447944 RepID=A0A6A4HMZ3_9AGAR|nr:hypothetical protein BT96DRAFT_648395 [Gymnopus androsaceus JB14]
MPTEKRSFVRLLLLWAPLEDYPVSQEWPGPCCNYTTWMDICPSSPRAVITPPMRSTPSPAAANSGPSRITVIPVPSKPASTQIELLPTSRASGAQGHATTIEGSAITILPPKPRNESKTVQAWDTNSFYSFRISTTYPKPTSYPSR